MPIIPNHVVMVEEGGEDWVGTNGLGRCFAKPRPVGADKPETARQLLGQRVGRGLKHIGLGAVASS
eukprot:1724371-Pyramimonas_sp.AAC.1